MGTLGEGLAVEMLRNFSLAQLAVQSEWEADMARRANKPPVWRWTPGTFVFPEGICCYCGGVMASRAIWRTDNLQFLGSWKVVDDGGGGVGHFEYEATHPHVHNGSICMGDDNNRASSVGDALFLAFNPLSTYFAGTRDEDGNRLTTTEDEIKAWFANRFDHVCGQGEAVATVAGVDLRHAVAPEDGCHCQHCRIHRGEVNCPRAECGEWYTPRVGHGGFRCGCTGAVRYYCVEHQHDEHYCTDCGDAYDLWSATLGTLDPNPQIKECGDCGEWVCTYCLGEEPDSERQHGCDGDDGGEDEDEVHSGHECCGCNRCCDCGTRRECADCGAFADECECDTE